MLPNFPIHQPDQKNYYVKIRQKIDPKSAKIDRWTPKNRQGMPRQKNLLYEIQSKKSPKKIKIPKKDPQKITTRAQKQ